MEAPETIALLRSAHDEITQLRRQVDVLAPKAHAYDTIAAAMRLKEPERYGAGVDVAWRLQMAVEELVAERDKTDAPKPTTDRSDPTYVEPEPAPRAVPKPYGGAFDKPVEHLDVAPQAQTARVEEDS